MHNRITVRLWSAAFLAGTMALSGCRKDALSVLNPDNPDVARVYGAPKDVETIISKLFQQMWNAQQGNVGIGVQTMVMSFESHSGLANFGMGARAAIPRGPISNDLGNSDQDIIFNDFDKLTRNSRSAANAIAAIDKFIAQGLTVGSPARNARARSFGYFIIGYGLGNLALLYDSAAIITPAVPAGEIPPLATSKAVMAVAFTMLDSALVITTTADATTGANGWPIPKAWLSATADVTLAQWQRIIHSYKARFRAGNARTPTERAAVDWAAVVADAKAGITSDFIVNANATTGWSATWVSQLAVDPTWSQMTPFILGMADTAGSYDAWLATPLTARAAFLLQTPDKRFPAGKTRTEQQAAGTGRGGTPVGSILYYRARPPGEDSPAAPWGNWYYDQWRFWGIRQAGGNGPVEAFTLAENDMLLAEGYIRTNSVALAVPLINKYRTPAGLAAIPAGTTDQNATVPGGTGCVPRVPQGPNGPTACGTVYEAMKWEKRLETGFTGYAQWFIDARGWGDLVEKTVLEWPVPWQELYARKNLTLYTTDKLRAAKGTYGF